MILVCNDKSEIDVIIVVDNPHGRGLIVGTCPVSSLPELKVDELLVLSWTRFRFPESRIRDHLSSAPLVEFTVENNRVSGPNGSVVLFSFFDVISFRKDRGFEQGDQGSLIGRFSMDNGVSPQAAPSFLTWRILVAVVDGHSESELYSAGEFV